MWRILPYLDCSKPCTPTPHRRAPEEPDDPLEPHEPLEPDDPLEPEEPLEPVEEKAPSMVRPRISTRGSAQKLSWTESFWQV